MINIVAMQLLMMLYNVMVPSVKLQSIMCSIGHIRELYNLSQCAHINVDIYISVALLELHIPCTYIFIFSEYMPGKT